MRRRAQVSAVAAAAALLLLLFLVPGCRRKPSSSARPLRPGQRFRFVDVMTSRKLPGLERGADGLLRLPPWGGCQPVIVSGGGTISQRFVAPGPLVLEVGLGVLPLGRTPPEGARFTVQATVGGRPRELLRREVTGASPPAAITWRPVRVEVPAEAGEEVEVRLSVARVGHAPATLVWVNPTVSAPSPAPPPNIVLVVVDALRADHLGCYGSPRQASPWMDQLASEGARFEEATSNATWTLASMLSLLTSSNPLVPGYSRDLDRPYGQAGAPATPITMPVSLPGELRKRGYATYGAVGGGFVDASFGFDSGYDWYWSPPLDRDTFLEEELSAIKRQLSARTPQPFFLLLHTYEVHNYLQGWGHDLDAFSRDYTGRLRDKKVLFSTVAGASSQRLSPADLQYLRDLYDGELRHTDRLLGQFFGWLRAQPWGKDTIIVLTADHGESFGERQLLSHGTAPYRELTHVPLLVHYPKLVKAGERRPEPVGLTDVTPTLLELSGGQPPAGLVGRSLAPLLRGGPAGADQPLLGEGSRRSLRLRLGSWDYLTWLGHPQESLFNLEADPEEKHDLARTQPAQLARMRHAFAEAVARAGRGYRLVASGERPQDITVTLSCEAGFEFFLYPTCRWAGEMWGNSSRAMAMQGKPYRGGKEKRLTVTIPAGGGEQVVLFDPAGEKHPVQIELRMGGKPVPAERLFLGAEGKHPGEGPLTLRRGEWSKAPGSLEPEGWGLRIWSLPHQAAAAPVPGERADRKMPEEVRRQLKNLGYTQ